MKNPKKKLADLAFVILLAEAYAEKWPIVADGSLSGQAKKNCEARIAGAKAALRELRNEEAEKRARRARGIRVL